MTQRAQGPLVIRHAQMVHLAQEPDSRLRLWLMDHLRRQFPKKMNALDDAAVGAIVDRGMARARGHGARSGKAICQFLDLMVALGDGFDQHPAYPWIRRALASRNLPDGNRRIAAAADLTAGRKLPDLTPRHPDTWT